MFTGLVETVGTVARIERRGVDATIRIACTYDHYEHGESIAVDGCCLSVTASGKGWFSAEASAETLRLTALGDRASGDPVHLERAMTPDRRLGGHLVTGHVDGVGRVVSQEKLGEALEVTFEVPLALAPFVAPKGSIAIDGVSLTVNRVADAAAGCEFSVNLIPHTVAQTTLRRLVRGAHVNLEIDTIARYVERMLAAGRAR